MLPASAVYWKTLPLPPSPYMVVDSVLGEIRIEGCNVVPLRGSKIEVGTNLPFS